MKVGIGYDVHSLRSGEDMIIGGVEIDHNLGLVGHSDADVLTHSIMDALLGAIGAGDIGRQFPDTDKKYKGISSLILLEQVREMIKDEKFSVNNIDAVIIAQRPKLAPYISEMEEVIAKTLEVEEDRINIKATTTEGLGFVGREEGIATKAIVSLKRGW